MKYSIRVAQMFAVIRTRIAAATLVAFDTCCFRNQLKRQLRIMTARYNAAYETMEAAESAREKDEESARAQLMQLRVNPESVRGRTGFMVSAFVPTDVLERLQKGTSQQRKAFHLRVCSVLMEHVLKGLFRVTSKGTMTAMIFEPLGASSNKRIVSALFETKEGKRVIESPSVSPDVRAIRDAQQRQLDSGE